MSTFVVTGVNKRLSKCYRPSYTNDLDPIYEDKIHTTNNNRSCDHVSTVLQTYFNGENQYERTNIADNDEVYKSENYESYQVKPERIQRETTSPMTSRPTSSCRSMIHQIMTNRKPPSSRHQHHVSFYYNNPNSTTKPPSLDSNKHSDCQHGVEITRKTSLYQVCDTVTGRDNRIYQSQQETVETVKTDTRSCKLKPATSIQKRFMCPIEVKYKRRCFVVCFVVVFFIIGVFIIVSVDGWTYKAKGRGVISETPIFQSMPPLINFTDIRNSSDYDY